MQTFLKQFSIVSGFVVLALLLIGNALITRRQLSAQIGAADWVLHTRQVLIELEETESLLLNAETGQRGYLLTGELKYLEPYGHASSQIEQHIQHLARLTSDNPDEEKRVDLLRGLAHEKLHELEETIALYRSGKSNQARAIVLSNLGLHEMAAIHQVIGDMQQEETALESARTAAYRKSIRTTTISIYIATSVAVLGLILLAYFIVKERALRDKHAQEISTREEWFRVTLSSIGDAVIATDRSGKVTFLNPVAEALIGMPAAAAVSRNVLSVFPIFNEVSGRPAENPVRKVMDLGHVVGLANHTVLKRADGRLVPIEDSAAPIRDGRDALIGVVLVFRDVTAERKSEEVLRKTEKLAAAARLSATVAHEINNPLEAIVNLLFIAKTSPDTPPAVAQLIGMAEQEVERVAHITRQTLGFFRESIAAESIDIAEIIDSVLKLYANKLHSKNIRVECALDECPPVHGMPGELKQVISNLIANAADAVGTDGAITISAQPASGEDSMVEVLIADDGPGIAPEHMDRIFEPFFTTKKDVGTGLGLWVTREIVERHGGSIRVEPRNGKVGLRGAAFTIRLPFAAEPGAEEPVSPAG
jgi:PAS domain S-box-containing protein